MRNRVGQDSIDTSTEQIPATQSFHSSICLMRNRGVVDSNEALIEHSSSNSRPKVTSFWLFCCRRFNKDFNQIQNSKPLCEAICTEPNKQTRKCFSWCCKKAKDINEQVSLSPSSKNRKSIDDKNRIPHSSRRFRVLGIDIDSWSPQSQYIFITCGVMLFLILYGYLQELVVMNKFKRNLGWFVTLLQLSGYAVCAAVQNYIMHGGKSDRRIPLRYYFILSILQVFMQGLTNISMHYLNYPAKTLFKSSRVIVTMLFGIIFLGRRYQVQDYIIALCMVVGLTTFVVADANSSPTFDPNGVILILIALTADAAILNLQEHCMIVFSAGHDELVYYSNVGAAGVAFCLSLATGELYKGILFLNVIGSVQVFGLFLAFSCVGFLGVSCLAALTKRFGALTSAITSVVRKGLTLIVSYVVFPDGKSLTLLHAFGAVVFMGSLLLKSVKQKTIKSNPSSTDTLTVDTVSDTLPTHNIILSLSENDVRDASIGRERHLSWSTKELPSPMSTASDDLCSMKHSHSYSDFMSTSDSVQLGSTVKTATGLFAISSTSSSSLSSNSHNSSSTPAFWPPV